MSKKGKQPSAAQQRSIRIQQIILYGIGILVIVSMILSMLR